VPEIFDRAAAELQAVGIRLLLGSGSPVWEDLASVKRLTVVPLRFASSNGNESLSLTLAATIQGGPPRYVVTLEVLGPLTCHAVQKLALECQDVWNGAYLRAGLWIGEGVNTRALNDISQIVGGKLERVTIAGVFLHSDFSRTVQQGLMVIAVLYRSILDHLSEAAKMRKLFNQLAHDKANVTPRFQRIIRP
jgi:hypothetical protein